MRGILTAVGALTISMGVGIFITWMAVNLTLGCSNFQTDPNCVHISEMLP